MRAREALCARVAQTPLHVGSLAPRHAVEPVKRAGEKWQARDVARNEFCMHVMEIVPWLKEIYCRGHQGTQVGSIRGAQRPLGSARDQTFKRRRVTLQNLHTCDEAHDAQQLVINARGELSICSVARERQGLLGHKTYLGATSPRRTGFPNACRDQRILYHS